MCHTSANVRKITEPSYTVSERPSRHPVPCLVPCLPSDHPEECLLSRHPEALSDVRISRTTYTIKHHVRQIRPPHAHQYAGTIDGINVSHRFDSMQAPSMANTIAIDSKQGRRAKPEGSPPLLWAFHPRSWGETPDERQFFRISSGILGRKHG